MNPHSYTHVIFKNTPIQVMDKKPSLKNIAGKPGYVHIEIKK
jgi:hypothetical protein